MLFFLCPTALVFSFYDVKYKRCSVMQSDRQIQGSPAVGETGGRERGTILVAKRRYSMGKPSADSKSAHPMVPTLLPMFRTFTSMPVQDDDWAKAADGRLAKAGTTNSATHRNLMRRPLCRALAVKFTPGFRSIDLFMILSPVQNCTA